MTVTLNLGPYAAFIVAAYAAALGIIAVLIAWIILDRRYLIRVIEDIEMRGIARRSQRGSEETP
jgi:heme exporter protein D